MSIPSESTINDGVAATDKAKSRKSYSNSKVSSRISCPSCKTKSLRRVSRKGFWQKHILTLFGYYPWECITCRKVYRFRERGVRRKHEE